MIIKIKNPDEWYKIDSSCVVRKGSMRSLRPYILGRDNFTCVYCGEKNGPLEVDHVMPISRGGTNEESNLVCACRACNRSKKDRTPEEWFESRGFK